MIFNHVPWFRVLLAAATLGAPASTLAQQRVSDTVHNLSVRGPGRIRAAGEEQVCIFCHAPHNTSGSRPLWNREFPLANYRIYNSSTLDARPGQPTGASKRCLSCHDGTIALGSVLSRGDRIRMTGGDYMPSGLTNLGTDLSDDHPVSFHYTSGLAASDRQLANPATLPQEVRLDATGQLQCTACHDPHNNAHGDFLTMRPEYGALCITCHEMNGWRRSSHQSSQASVAGSRYGDFPFSNVAENACRSCHRPHSAGGPERLLIHKQEEETCLTCHDGSVARADIRRELDKLTAHDPRRYVGMHDPAETLNGAKPHVECSDCHNPHAVGTEFVGGRAENSIGPTLAYTRGVSAAGGSIAEAQYEYEVCFRCHAESAVRTSRRVSRQIDTPNLRLSFARTSQSYHPVIAPANSLDTVSLVVDLPRGSMIRCTDCHNNDSGPRNGGIGPNGPHGSTYDYLLERNYSVRDNTPESETDYALCYKCHQRSIVLSDRSFPLHRLHVVDEQAPCSACHDPHGVSRSQFGGYDHTHLINFDSVIVRREPTTGQLNFRDLGSFSGSCTLQCHGSVHRDRTYGRDGPA